MTEAGDPVTDALTGVLPFLLLVAAVLTWPVAKGLLALYTRSVRKSMRTRSSIASAEKPALAPATPAAPNVVAPGELLHEVASAPPSAGAARLLEELLMQPWRVAAVYTIAGLTYALVTTIALFTATDLEALPISFLIVFVTFAWPLVITVGIVAAATRPMKALMTAAYFLVLMALGAISIPASPDQTWGQLITMWAVFNLPATLLFLTYLARPVRAVGPLILTFLFVGLAGSNAAVSIAASDDRYLRFFIEVSGAVGIGAVASIFGLMLIGFSAFGVVGWLALGWIRRRYQAKLISDESVTVDSLWLLFAATHSIGLVFEHVLWALAGVAAFAAYKTSARIGFSWLRRQAGAREKPPKLLLLRSFSIGKDSERLFDALEKHWRRVGSIQMIAGIDLARRSVEPHEFLDFLSGKLARRFIDGPETLARRFDELDARPDRDLRFRVNDFFCYDDTWKTVLSRLVHDSDAVLMDLRGFSRHNSGCVFEIHELVARVPLERVVFVVNESTDRRLLNQTLRDAAGGLHRNGAEVLSAAAVVHLKSIGRREFRRLLLALAMAAEPSQERA